VESRFSVGQVVHHLKFGYRGVIIAANPAFQGTQAWYDHVATSRPPTDRPWYHVLVDGESHSTYVAEGHLQADVSGAPVEHPALKEFFDQFHNGYYSNSRFLH